MRDEKVDRKDSFKLTTPFKSFNDFSESMKTQDDLCCEPLISMFWSSAIEPASLAASRKLSPQHSLQSIYFVSVVSIDKITSAQNRKKCQKTRRTNFRLKSQVESEAIISLKETKVGGKGIFPHFTRGKTLLRSATSCQ